MHLLYRISAAKGMVEQALKKRRHRPVFMVDIAVPRDIEPEVGELADVFLYTVDDLEEVIEENRRHRQVAADQAESLIEHGVGSWQHERRIRNGGELIRDYRRHGEALRDQARDQALERLAKGEDPVKVVERLAHQASQPPNASANAHHSRNFLSENHDLLSAAPRLLLPPEAAFEQPAPPAKRQKDDTPHERDFASTFRQLLDRFEELAMLSDPR